MTAPITSKQLEQQAVPIPGFLYKITYNPLHTGKYGYWLCSQCYARSDSENKLMFFDDLREISPHARGCLLRDGGLGRSRTLPMNIIYVTGPNDEALRTPFEEKIEELKLLAKEHLQS
jgi:hypothetical protein